MLKLIKIIVLILNSVFVLSVQAEESREGDSLALVAIAEANPYSKSNWDYSVPLDDWDGVNLADGRVDSLVLRYEYIKSLPTEIGNLTNLANLDLYGNRLTTLPVEIGNLTNLVNLDLENNSLTYLPAEIGNLTNLVNLDLRNNSLTSIPAEIGNLTNLTKLDLGYTHLICLPTEIGNLTNLANLDLGSNSLTSIPAEIGNLTNLTSLNLRFNILTSLLAEIGNLTNLTKLDLFENSLVSLPSNIGKLTNLESLKIRRNNLSFNDIELCKEQLPNLISGNGLEGFWPWNDYSPQDSLPTYLSNDSSFLFVAIGGSANRYQWYKNGSEIVGATTDTLQIENSDILINTFICEANSSVITDLTLWTECTLTPGDQATSIDEYMIEKSNASIKSKQFDISINNNRIVLSLNQPENVAITIFDLRGRVVSKPFTKQSPAGMHMFDIGKEISKGIYFAQVNVDNMSYVKKISIK